MAKYHHSLIATCISILLSCQWYRSPKFGVRFNDQITLIYSIIPFPSTSFSQDISLYHCIKAMIQSLNLVSILLLIQKLKFLHIRSHLVRGAYAQV